MSRIVVKRRVIHVLLYLKRIEISLPFIVSGKVLLFIENDKNGEFLATVIRSGLRRRLLGTLLVVAIAHTATAATSELPLTPAQLTWVGERIFQNECANQPMCLVHWNEGEAFPSLGIGHFIWYPSGVEGRFVETFPGFVGYVLKAGYPVPPWLASLSPMDAPWPDRTRFLAAQDSREVTSLRDWLDDTKGMQTAYILERARSALTRVVAAAPENEQPILRQRLIALTGTPGGSYALIDYVNFKGEGLAPTETYGGQGWGLLQVLQQMTWQPETTTLEAFRQAAAKVLTRRAANASDPIERERWLPGWLNRLETYREPLL
jgi:hypothetical protein